MWDCYDGMLCLAYDHSKSNILKGCGRRCVRGENLEYRFLKNNVSSGNLDMLGQRNVYDVRGPDIKEEI